MPCYVRWICIWGPGLLGQSGYSRTSQRKCMVEASLPDAGRRTQGREAARSFRSLLRLVREDSCDSAVAVTSRRGVQGVMPAPLAVLRYGGVASVVYALMEDALDAALADAPVQTALMQFIGQLSTRADTLPLLSAPTSWPIWLTPTAPHGPADGGAPAGGNAGGALCRASHCQFRPPLHPAILVPFCAPLFQDKSQRMYHLLHTELPE